MVWALGDLFRLNLFIHSGVTEVYSFSVHLLQAYGLIFHFQLFDFWWFCHYL